MLLRHCYTFLGFSKQYRFMLSETTLHMWLQIDLCISSEFVRRFHNSTLMCNVKMQYLRKQHKLEKSSKSSLIPQKLRVVLGHINILWLSLWVITTDHQLQSSCYNSLRNVLCILSLLLGCEICTYEINESMMITLK